MKNKKYKESFSLTLAFALLVFAILLLSIALAWLTVFILTKVGVFGEFPVDMPSLTPIMLLMALISLVVGFVGMIITSSFPIKSINHVITQLNRLADGDFTARLKFGRTMSAHPAVKSVTDSFNKMAEELESTEMLRSDFINNFSHEFKTPIVSIAGFARLLKRDNLTDAQREEYIAIIEEESLRLSHMATEVLNLTKLENQAILTDITEFNLSEQIRSSVLLLESKWARKNIEIAPDFDEYTVRANEEMLKQVWINLIDNVVKFSPEYGTVRIAIMEERGEMLISVSNTGTPIPPEEQGKIFNKFYQSDRSRSSEGSGVGLAVVKRIVDLHEGEVSVHSDGDVTTFPVKLKKI
ncbi:MAG: HAMP domain-containing histidine kinase [Clostridia bacterium]|nr:HAMP domain-containing histidine kinase [Clostridia bacterium]